MTERLLFISILIFAIIQIGIYLWEIKKIDEICNGTKKKKSEK